MTEGGYTDASVTPARKMANRTEVNTLLKEGIANDCEEGTICDGGKALLSLTVSGIDIVLYITCCYRASEESGADGKGPHGDMEA